MTLSATAVLITIAAVAAFLLWVGAEICTFRSKVRLLTGFLAMIGVAFVVNVLFQVVAATREHYFRTVLLNLSKEAAAGHTDFVNAALRDYAGKVSDPEGMRAIVDLDRELMKRSFEGISTNQMANQAVEPTRAPEGARGSP